MTLQTLILPQTTPGKQSIQTLSIPSLAELQTVLATKADIAAAVTTLSAKIDGSTAAILAAIAGGVTPPPSTVDSTTIPPLIAAAKPDATGTATVQLPAGTFAPFDTHPGFTAGVTTLHIVGAANFGTIVDGQGGAAAGHRLMYGRAGINAAGPHVIIDGLKVVNCGSASQSSDGESAIRNDAAWGTVLLEVINSWLENNEDGILTSPDASGANTPVNLSVDNTLFRKNGVVPDGRSHSIYAEGAECHVKNSTFDQGSLYGWCVKSRCAITSIAGSTLTAGSPDGGCLDAPNGGAVTVTGSSLSINIHGNMIGFNEEGNTHPGDMTYDGCAVTCNNQNPYVFTGGGGNVLFKANCTFPSGQPTQSPASTGGQVLFGQ